MRRKAMTITSAVVFGGCMLIVGLVNLRSASYGGGFLGMMASVYPGYHDSRTIGDVVIGTLYGILDGAIIGYVFSSLYRWMSRSEAGTANHPVLDQPAPLRRAS
jgi:hypothetical protein